MNADPAFARYLSPTGEPFTPEESAAAFARYRVHWEEHGYGVWVVEERATGRAIGRLGLSHHRLWPQDVEVGWALDPSAWGRGYATEGGRAALEHAFTVLGRDRVVSIVLPDNVAPIAVMTRLGIEPWRSVGWPDGELELEVRAIARDKWAQSHA